MAVREVRSCDKDGAEGASQHVIMYDGLYHTIDLCTKCEEATEKALGPLLDSGTEVSAAEARKLTTVAGNGTEVDPSAVRAWAAAQNPPITVGKKGRIPENIVAQYLAATQADTPPAS